MGDEAVGSEVYGVINFLLPDICSADICSIKTAIKKSAFRSVDEH